VLESFLVQPFIALILISIICGLLGVFVLWKKLSYFGDALSHSILFGLVLSAFFEVNQIFALIIFAFIFSFLVALIGQNRYFSKDTIVMILSYFLVSLAIILNDVFVKDFYFNTYIFGDILTAQAQEIQCLAAIAIVTVFYVIFSFKKILLINFNKDLAKVENIKTEFWNISFLILLSLSIALSARFVGVFLMTALLILPAAIARIFAVSASQMIVLSLVIAILVAAASFKVATIYDLNISSMIVVGFSAIFILSLIFKKVFLSCRI
jgi:zinc transport system permease protein